jgi:hypothetical protein
MCIEYQWEGDPKGSIAAPHLIKNKEDNMSRPRFRKEIGNLGAQRAA